MSKDTTKNPSPAAAKEEPDFFEGAELASSDLPRYAINDPQEGDDCLALVEGVYEGSFEEKIEGKPRLAHRIFLRKPLDDHKRIILWGNHQIDSALPVLPIGTKVRLSYKGLRPLKQGRTLKEILVEFPANTKLVPHPYRTREVESE